MNFVFVAIRPKLLLKFFGEYHHCIHFTKGKTEKGFYFLDGFALKVQVPAMPKHQRLDTYPTDEQGKNTVSKKGLKIERRVEVNQIVIA